MTYKIKQLWPTPLYMNKIEVSKEVLDFTFSYDYERMKSNNGSYTSNKKILDSLPTLKVQIENEIQTFTHDYLKVGDNVNFYITTSWINKHIPGDHSHIHHHANAIFSGVYYIKHPENGGDFVIHDNPMTPNVCHKTVILNYKETNDVNTDQYRIKPKDGLLIMFPSFVMHSVENNQSNEDRYSLAFNVFVKGKLGTKEFELEL